MSELLLELRRAYKLLGVPLDAGFDWLAFALAVVTLFRFFPAELVAEHYRRIFG